MNTVQKQILDVLRYFINLCETHHLTYYICGGTLLGAIRHRGFIPWDDDVDVEMPYEDYQKFLSLSDQLRPNYFMQNRSLDPEYPLLMTKLCNTTIPYEAPYQKKPLGVHIDVFPLMPAKSYSKATKAAYYVIRECEYVLRGKVGWRPYYPNSRLARFGYRILKCLSVKQLMRLQQWAIRCIYDPSGQTYCSVGGTYHAHQEFSPMAWYAGTETVSFEGVPCSACAGWDAWLTGHYGDYMTLPPEEKRKSHHI